MLEAKRTDQMTVVHLVCSRFIRKPHRHRAAAIRPARIKFGFLQVACFQEPRCGIAQQAICVQLSAQPPERNRQGARDQDEIAGTRHGLPIDAFNTRLPLASNAQPIKHGRLLPWPC